MSTAWPPFRYRFSMFAKWYRFLPKKSWLWLHFLRRSHVMIIKEKTAPPSKVAPFSKTAPLFFSVGSFLQQERTVQKGLMVHCNMTTQIFSVFIANLILNCDVGSLLVSRKSVKQSNKNFPFSLKCRKSNLLSIRFQTTRKLPISEMLFSWHLPIYQHLFL